MTHELRYNRAPDCTCKGERSEKLAKWRCVALAVAYDSNLGPGAGALSLF